MRKQRPSCFYVSSPEATYIMYIEGSLGTHLHRLPSTIHLLAPFPRQPRGRGRLRGNRAGEVNCIRRAQKRRLMLPAGTKIEKNTCGVRSAASLFFCSRRRRARDQERAPALSQNHSPRSLHGTQRRPSPRAHERTTPLTSRPAGKPGLRTRLAQLTAGGSGVRVGNKQI